MTPLSRSDCLSSHDTKCDLEDMFLNPEFDPGREELKVSMQISVCRRTRPGSTAKPVRSTSGRRGSIWPTPRVRSSPRSERWSPSATSPSRLYVLRPNILPNFSLRALRTQHVSIRVINKLWLLVPGDGELVPAAAGPGRVPPRQPPDPV